MKIQERDKCRELRKDGISIKKIAKDLRVSPASVSLWTRDIILNDSQIDKLKTRKGNPIWSKKNRDKRINYQNEGKKLVYSLSGDKKELLIAGCMLYWAEGTKKKNTVVFSNSDHNMIKYFVYFLKDIFNVKNEDITIYLNCHTDIHSLEEIERYWLISLVLPKKCCKKHTVNYYSSYSYKKRKGKLEYGVCTIQINSTEIVQKIYGAIQEIVRFKEDGNWLQ